MFNVTSTILLWFQNISQDKGILLRIIIPQFI